MRKTSSDPPGGLPAAAWCRPTRCPSRIPPPDERSPRRVHPPAPSSPYELGAAALLAEPCARKRWEAAFGALLPLRIEIGVGNSDFLIEASLREPQFNYLGFEYSRKRVAKFLRRVEARGLRNIRMVRTDAAAALGFLVGPGSADRVYIHFPDPWPKHRHAKHRLVQPALARVLRDLLRPGGGLSLRTDDPVYAGQMLAVLEGVEGLENTAGQGRFAGAPRDAIPTSYELKYRHEGRAIFYLEFRRASGEAGGG